MFQRAISIQDAADIIEAMNVIGRADAGFVLTITGKHPDLGAVVLIQDPHPGLIVLSEQQVQGARVAPADDFAPRLKKSLRKVVESHVCMCIEEDRPRLRPIPGRTGHDRT